MRRYTPVRIRDVAFDGEFWGARTDVNRRRTIPHAYAQLDETGRLDAYQLSWKPGDANPPHKFWDSDVAKWVEAASYALQARPDKRLRALVNQVTKLICSAQQPDGYLNAHYTVVEPEHRWKNLRDNHELYCAGHLIEAAVAHYQATGEQAFLDVMRGYADLIDSLFGRSTGKKRGYPGHEEIELALVKLYRSTGEKRYLDLAEYFILERGRKPHYYDRESMERGEAPAPNRQGSRMPYDHWQAHLPVTAQRTAEGHAVRAMYLYSGMADVAAETGNARLLVACRRLWKDVVGGKLYITGGIGSSSQGERFTVPYDLPNEGAYAETCAAIGLVFFAHRMVQLDCDARYTDVMERAVYNGVLSGVSLKGNRFFYANRLAVGPMLASAAKGAGRVPEHMRPIRQPWFGCACCPPNVARLLASLGQYAYSTKGNELAIHLYTQGSVSATLGGKRVTVMVLTRYPWKGDISLRVSIASSGAGHAGGGSETALFTLALRIPGWCADATMRVLTDELDMEKNKKKGYVRVRRSWRDGDTVQLHLDMPVKMMAAHPRVSTNSGRVALQRGPIVYCVEEVDNTKDLDAIVLPAEPVFHAQHDKKLLGGVTMLTCSATRMDLARWKGALYAPRGRDSSANAGSGTRVTLKAIPYYAWSNRKPGEMIVWLRRREGAAQTR